MTTTDPDALTERIARTAHHHDEVETHARPRAWEDEHPERRGEYLALATAVLPIIAAEVRKAKAEALRELSAHISEVVDNAKPWQVFTEHVLHEAGACDYLDRAATEYEAGASDEHR